MKLTEEEIAKLNAIGFVWNLGTRPDASAFEGVNIAEDQEHSKYLPKTKRRLKMVPFSKKS